MSFFKLLLAKNPLEVKETLEICTFEVKGLKSLSIKDIFRLN